MFKNEGLLENSVGLPKTTGQTLRRDDSYGAIFDQDNKLHNTLLGDSIRLNNHPNINSNLNFSVELDEDNKLFR